MNCIFPVKNYSEENTPNSDVNSLILDALRNIVTAGGVGLSDQTEIQRETQQRVYCGFVCLFLFTFTWKQIIEQSSGQPLG